ncbi:SAM-dependent methyltransferase [Knoellia sinensis KCTC 19936]|uniref:SAM-dependent methyltransferase n=1 Tax=Knoellia sinensis KCTC 19936 TaxID=1385520 RepID=A0A0A0J7S6_9MICO|nr:class I SAM-dependent methyltransferase [Knoellia sinensis]KGN32087.1 SAM-dependent methyltransferase [Knoellia sinensis KCTC 19936]
MSARVPHLDLDLIARLRTDLAAADFTVTGVLDVLGPLASSALLREQPLPARRVAGASNAPAATLIRLFTLGDPVDVSEVDVALPTLRATGAVDLGLLDEEGDAVVARFDVRPYAADERHWWVVSDLAEVATGSPVREDHVLGIGGASTTLAAWTIRRPVGTALDLGTGCGVQALHLGAHADSIVATDLSERALAFARFTAALNDVHWDVRDGSMLEPVAGQRFDLIVSNPPFVITPRSGEVPLFEYRDGGAAGDAVVAGLVRSIGEHLEPGGVAQFLGNWEVPAGSTWTERVGGWLDGAGVDAWVVQREVQDPAEYAETWSRDGGHHAGTADFDAMYAAWLDDFASRDIESIGLGVITLHRPTTDREPFLDLMDERGPVPLAMGEAVWVGLEARTWLAEHTDDEVLDRAWKATPDVTEERHTLPGASDPSVIVARQGGGLGRIITLSTVTAAYLSVADGELTPRQAAGAIAGILDVDPAETEREIVAFVRDAAKDALLVEAQA